MALEPVNELQDFHRFVGEKVNLGESSLTPEAVLREWRQLNPDPTANEDDLAAIQEAIDDMDAGDRGIPLEEFDRDFRARHNLS